MVLSLLEKDNFNNQLSFLYGVREDKDSFYLDEMRLITEKLNLEFLPFLSADTQAYAQTGYVTDWIKEDNIKDFTEFYICGSPAMVKDSREKLEALGVAKENIFFEPY